LISHFNLKIAKKIQTPHDGFIINIKNKNKNKIQTYKLQSEAVQIKSNTITNPTNITT
jgi:hypothetical protein